MTTALRGREASTTAKPPGTRLSAWRGFRIGLASVVAMLSIVPVWRLLGRPDTGLAGAATVDMAESYAAFIWAGLAAFAIPALLAARTLDPESIDRLLDRLKRLLEKPATVPFAVACASFAFLAASAFGMFALRGQPNLIDAMSQLVHARLIADGSWAGPGPEFGAFWQPQQSLFTPAGWVSQYPPGHVLLLALGMKLGAAWAVGPFMLAVTVFFAALGAERLLPGRLAVARCGAMLIAFSPFLIAHAGAYMNHTTAAAFAAIAVCCAARAKPGLSGWAVAAGLAVGAMFAVRPLSALTLGVVIAGWFAFGRDERGAGHRSRRLTSVAAVAAGALPFVLLVAFYNQHFFGSPTTFGYNATLGPAGGLGFGLDPWGNTFGVTEAVAYTSAELVSLSLFLLETPVPLVALIMIWLAVTPRLESGERLLAGWAIAPLVAQLAYWHHGLFMGPRMLNETAPAWCLLAAITAASLTGRLPARSASLRSYSPRVFGITFGGAAIAAAILLLAPMRLASDTQRPTAPAIAATAGTDAIVFVHGGWTSRLAARLAASGLRADSLETALRQNPTCAVQRYADARAAGERLPGLDFDRRATPLPRSVELSPGNRIRVAPDESLSGECARQAGADRFGTIDVTPLLWLGAVPGSDVERPLYVRDLGPASNAELLAQTPGRTAWVLVPSSPEAAPGLMPFETAMRTLWGDPAGVM